MAIIIYTDGGCRGNPGRGGWAYVITRDGALLEEKAGGEAWTTNNRMELSAVINALESPAVVGGAGGITIFTDSRYVQQGISEWIKAWKQKGWKTAGKKPVKNIDLWQKLDALSAALSEKGGCAAKGGVHWQWVKGHAGNPLNERCDALVQEAMGKAE